MSQREQRQAVDQRADNPFVVAGVAALEQIQQRQMPVDGLAIRPLACHGVVRAGHGDDAGKQIDLVADQAARVAGAVEPLVVLESGQGDVIRKREALQDPVAKSGMGPDHLGFLGAERTRIHVQRIRQLEHADVVQQGGEAQLDEPVGRKLESVADGQGEHGGIHAVLVQVVFRRMGKLGQSQDSVPVALDLVDQLFDPVSHRPRIDAVVLAELLERRHHEMDDGVVQRPGLLGALVLLDVQVQRRRGGFGPPRGQVRRRLDGVSLGKHAFEAPAFEPLEQLGGDVGLRRQQDVSAIQIDWGVEVLLQLDVLHQHLSHGPSPPPIDRSVNIPYRRVLTQAL